MAILKRFFRHYPKKIESFSIVFQQEEEYDLSGLRVEFLLKTDSGYPKDAEVTLFTFIPTNKQTKK